MYIYLIINILIIAIGITVPEKVVLKLGGTKKSRTIPLQSVLLFVLLLLFMGFRGGFTTDYKNYSAFFGYLCESVTFGDVWTESFSMEKGFVLLSKVIGAITHSELYYHLILSFVLLLFYFRGLTLWNNGLLWFGVLLFVNLGDYYGSMNLVRQCLAAAIAFNGFSLIKDKKIIKFLLLVLVAATIHTSALIMVFGYFFLRLDINKLSRKVGLIIAVATEWFGMDYALVFIGDIFPRYQDYQYGMEGGTFNAVIPILAVYIFLLVSVKFFVTGYDAYAMKNRMLLNGTLLCVLFLVLGMRIYMFTRLAYYFRPFVCLAVPNMLSQYSNKKNKHIMMILICLVAILFTQVTLSGTGYDPYYFYWG